MKEPDEIFRIENFKCGYYNGFFQIGGYPENVSDFHCDEFQENKEKNKKKATIFGRSGTGKSIAIDKKTSENGVDIYSNGQFAASLSVAELEEIYKKAIHIQIEGLKG